MLWAPRCCGHPRSGCSSAQTSCRTRNNGAASTFIAAPKTASELSALRVRLDPEVPDFVSLDRLAAAHGVSACDAAYLKLALRRSLVLFSLDARLIAAAGALGHPVLSAASDGPAADAAGNLAGKLAAC